MMIETTRADTNISPLSQSYENTDLDVHDREEKLYAKVFDPSEFEGKTKEDLVFFDCDYILRCVSGPYYGRQIRLKDLGENITIGSSENKCKFCVKDELISEVHCQLNYIEDSFYYSLEDCNSETNTWIQILSIEDGYEVNENTDFKLFSHEFSIVFDEVRKNKKSECLIKFTGGERKGKTYEMLKGETVRIGKKDEKITLQMDEVQESVLIKIVSLNDKIYILDETQEPYDGGLFMKLKNKILIRSGDCFKIGNSSFRLIPYNYAFFK